MKEGWDLIDPFRLPHSISSSLAATVAIELRARGIAFSTTDGHIAAARAFHRAVAMLDAEVLSHAIVGGAEEISDFHLFALAQAGMPDFFDHDSRRNVSHVTEGACLFLMGTGASSCAEDVIRVSEYVEFQQDSQESAAEFGKFLALRECDSVFCGNYSAHLPDDLSGMLHNSFGDRFHSAGDTLGDLFGASFAFSVAQAFEDIHWRKAWVFSSNRHKCSAGVLVSR